MFLKKVTLSRPVIAINLFLGIILMGCGLARTVRVAPAPPVIATLPGFVTPTPSSTLALPQATATSEATQTATPVITQTATQTLTPSPTHTQTPTATPTATSLPPTSPPPTESLPQATVQYVVIISIDGLRPDALALADTPVLDSLQAVGAYTPNAKTVVPSVTLISHASMLGGMIPQKHGIDWNTFEPDRGKINGPTLFSVAREAGLSTAMVVGKDKLEHLVLPGSVDQYFYAGFTDRQVTTQAVQIIHTTMPNLLFIHLPDVDTAGHLTGWMSSGQLFALSLTDSMIGEVVNALQTGNYFEQTLLIISSDHGGSGTSHGSASIEDTTIPWLAVGPGVTPGTILERQVMIYDTAATAAHALNLAVPEVWDGQPSLEILK